MCVYRFTYTNNRLLRETGASEGGIYVTWSDFISDKTHLHWYFYIIVHPN
jgi:hypothetical protein